MYVDFVSYDEYTSVNAAKRCKVARPTLTCSSTQLVKVGIGAVPGGATYECAIKVFDTVLVICHSYLNNTFTWKKYTASGFPEKQTTASMAVIDDYTATARASTEYNTIRVGSATLLSNGTLYSNGTITTVNIHGIDFYISIEYEIYETLLGTGIIYWVSVKLPSQFVLDFDLTSITSTEKAFGVLAANFKANHDYNYGVTKVTLPTISAP
jgi:hypothetical protein